MIIEPNSLWANCSEAVFRFSTLKPKKMQAILQAIADEIGSLHEKGGVKKWVGQKIPLLNSAEDYDSHYGGKPSYSFQYSGSSKQKMSDKEATKLAYPKGALLYACAGLGDNEAVITVEKDKGAFVLNIGNNDIVENKTGWVETIKEMGIKVRYAGDNTKEGDKLQEKYARDCTCGITYGFGHEV